MPIASDLLQRHIETLVEDNAQWQTLIADDILWELAYAPAIGHPARLSGREVVVRHVAWFLGAVENFRFFDLKMYAFADPEAAAAEVKAQASSSLPQKLQKLGHVFWGHHTHFCISLRTVFFTEKGLLWAIAPLGDMVGEAGRGHSCDPCHAVTLGWRKPKVKN